MKLVVPQSLYDRMVMQGFDTSGVVVAKMLPVSAPLPPFEDDECQCAACRCARQQGTT